MNDLFLVNKFDWYLVLPYNPNISNKQVSFDERKP